MSGIAPFGVFSRNFFEELVLNVFEDVIIR
jgi:hypothetical protein